MKRTFTILSRRGDEAMLYAAGYAHPKGGEFTVSQWTHLLSAAFSAAEKANKNPVLLARLRTVRFWHFLNGAWVRITLHPGQKLSWGKSSWNGEGWSSESESWEHEGTRIVHCWGESGSDCDGRSSSGGEASCPMNRLTAVPAYDAPGIFRPDWKQIASGQRDYAAEAAGY